MVFRIKQNDDKTACKATLQTDGNAIDLTTATDVHIIIKDGTGIIVDKAAYISDASNGKVWFPFEASETSRPGSSFKGEFTVTFDDGRKETYPSSGYLMFEITPSLGGTTNG